MLILTKIYLQNLSPAAAKLKYEIRQKRREADHLSKPSMMPYAQKSAISQLGGIAVAIGAVVSQHNDSSLAVSIKTSVAEEPKADVLQRNDALSEELKLAIADVPKITNHHHCIPSPVVPSKSLAVRHQQLSSHSSETHRHSHHRSSWSRWG